MSPSVSVRLLLTQSDARLAAFAHAGHERAFEALVQRYRRPLLGYCRRLLLSDECAEEALQQALLQAWLALRSGAEVSDVKPWLYRIVHNAALNMLRVSGYDYCKLSESLSGADAPQEDLERRIAVREALAGLAALPEMQRKALLRTAVEGDSHRQVARELGVSENALRGLVYRARVTLRAAAGAIVPPPLVSWALSAGGRGAPTIERLAELGAGGGSAGVAGLLIKGGAVAVTASVLAGGIAAVHAPSKAAHGRRASHANRHPAHARMASTAVVATRFASVGPEVGRRRALANDRQSPAHRPASRRRRIGSRPSAMPFTTAIAPPPPPVPPRTRGGDGRRGRADDGGKHDKAQSLDSSASRSDATAGRDGNESHDTRHAGQVSEGGDGSSRHDERNGRSSGEASDGDPSGGDPSGVSPSGINPSGINPSGINPSGISPHDSSQGNTSSGGSRGDGFPESNGPESLPERRGSLGASSSTSTNSSSKDGQSSTSEATKGG